MSDESPAFRQFLLSSSLSRPEMREFALRLTEFAPPDESDPHLRFAAAPIPLRRSKDRLQATMEARISNRTFASTPLTLRDLGELCSPLAATKSEGRRAWASAGARHPVETFVLALRVEGVAPAALYYDGETHSLTPVAELPAWNILEPLLNVGPADPSVVPPAAVFLVVLMPRRTTGRYGERGGRFVLLEAGQVLQSLALRAAASGFAGFALGGTLDREIKELIGASGTDATVVVGYACGRRGRA